MPCGPDAVLGDTPCPSAVLQLHCDGARVLRTEPARHAIAWLEAAISSLLQYSRTSRWTGCGLRRPCFGEKSPDAAFARSIRAFSGPGRRRHVLHRRHHHGRPPHRPDRHHRGTRRGCRPENRRRDSRRHGQSFGSCGRTPDRAGHSCGSVHSGCRTVVRRDPRKDGPAPADEPAGCGVVRALSRPGSEYVGRLEVDWMLHADRHLAGSLRPAAEPVASHPACASATARPGDDRRCRRDRHRRHHPCCRR